MRELTPPVITTTLSLLKTGLSSKGPEEVEKEGILLFLRLLSYRDELGG